MFPSPITDKVKPRKNRSILLSGKTSLFRRLVSSFTNSMFFLITSVSVLTVFFIIFFIAKDAIPFFKLRGIKEFFTSIKWYPSAENPDFGALPIIYGTLFVTTLSTLIAVPLSLLSAISLSDILPFSIRQIAKPVIEIISIIPSVAFGFFALIIFAPYLQKGGGDFLGLALLIIGFPVALITTMILTDIVSVKLSFQESKIKIRLIFLTILTPNIIVLHYLYELLIKINISSGTNILNVSVILAIMATPTIVSVSEDTLFSVGRELREGSYALGATRFETITKVVLPAAKSGVLSGIILGIMRALGETMVVWMASGNAAQIPKPFYNITVPIRTLTATIAGDMGEADQITGSARYHVLFAMALLLLLFSFFSNLISEWIKNRSKKTGSFR